MGDEVNPPPTGSSLSTGHSCSAPMCCLVSEVKSLGMMVVVFSLVEQCDGDITSEWPLEMVVKLSTHQVDIARHMSTFTTPKSISIHPQAHLVPLRVGVESITVPCVIVPFVLLSRHP